MISNSFSLFPRLFATIPTPIIMMGATIVLIFQYFPFSHKDIFPFFFLFLLFSVNLYHYIFFYDGQVFWPGLGERLTFNLKSQKNVMFFLLFSTINFDFVLIWPCGQILVFCTFLPCLFLHIFAYMINNFITLSIIYKDYFDVCCLVWP